MSAQSRTEPLSKSGRDGVDAFPHLQVIELLTNIHPNKYLQTTFKKALTGGFKSKSMAKEDRQEQEPLVEVEPRRPPMTNVGIETAFRHE